MYTLQTETHYEEERETVQRQLLEEQNTLLDKYKQREVSYYSIMPSYMISLSFHLLRNQDH